MLVDAITVAPFAVPLLEPFTISRASVSSTRAVLVRARVREGDRVVEGYGEGALPLGSSEQPSELLARVAAAAAALGGASLANMAEIARAVDAALANAPVARSALHCALADAFGRATGKPLYELLGATAPVPMVTDITLPINDPQHMAELASGHSARGFRCFKIKVGADLAADVRVIELLARTTPEASLRLDANEAFAADRAVALLRAARAAGMPVECFEQPCARADLAGMRRVREEGGGVPVVADEAVRDLADLERLHAAAAIDGINLKLVKMGGVDRCLAIGQAARALGLRMMVGAMIESRLGLTAMAHVVAALGGVEWVDLDTAFLLAHDPCRGGMRADGPALSLPRDPGLGLELG